MSHGESKQEVLCDILNAFKNHHGIKLINKKIKENKLDWEVFLGKEKFFFKPAIPIEIKKLIKCLDKNKTAGIVIIPPKLIKIAVDFLTQLLTTAINKNAYRGKYFPRLCKAVVYISCIDFLIVPLDKGKPNKNEIPNFTPVNVLNTF